MFYNYRCVVNQTKKHGCGVCGESGALLFRCHRCNGLFCVVHHLPENHVCLNISEKPPTQEPFKIATYTIPVEYSSISPRKTFNTKKASAVFSVLFIAAFLVYVVVYPPSLNIFGEEVFFPIPQDVYDLHVFPDPTPVRDIFTSTQGLIEYLRVDDLSDREWTEQYTCDNFAKDFIKRAEEKNYYCFTYHGIWSLDLIKYNAAVESISVTKQVQEGLEIRSYEVAPFVSGVGHAVVKVTVGAVELLVDPQTDIILTLNFKVVYEGEITE